ncbi:MAG: erythronate-4-phosphate dehydrogenase [Osedax symbiont Rs1]|nr:MAG: erythronate-4-phosphate dehydrogenase [Osedax symbiont Rs1]
MSLAHRKLSIVADENIPGIAAMFARFGAIQQVDGRSLTPEGLQGVDVLLVRSVTKVTRQLLVQSSVKFVGSATIGTDHIDTQYLAANNIAFSSAPGCNADAVVEYDLCCITQLLDLSNRQLKDLTVAIVGVGNVGRRVADRLTRVGVKKILLNDPPRAKFEQGFVSLEECLSSADIILLHTPLLTTGPWPTKHLLNKSNLKLLKKDAILLNAGRGPVIKGADLCHFLVTRSDIKVVLDVWEAEPVVDHALANLVAIATPHIAGYSLEGKLRGTYMLKVALAKWLGLEVTESLNEYLPKPAIESVEIAESADPLSIMRLLYDPLIDDRALRATLGLDNQAEAFDLLRKNYPIRREFNALTIKGDLDCLVAQYLKNLGFA